MSLTEDGKRTHIIDSFMASFDPIEMSTQDGDGSTKSFNFADFPCPPPQVDLHGKPYQPFLVPPPSLLDQLRK